MSSVTSEVVPGDLRRKTARGALVSTTAQGASFVLRTAALIVLARLLLKEDFGLVNMVTAFIGFLGLIRDAGLSMATVQCVSITRSQSSTLFWINLAVGGALTLLAMAAAPLLVTFYTEPRLFWVTVALALGLFLNCVGTQHRAMLQRSMRFGALGAIDLAALALGVALALTMAVTGYGYWSLVAMWTTPLLVSTLSVWLATGWIPSRPRWGSGIQSMLVFGGTITLNSVVVYAANNVDKVLIGRVWGAEALGIYGRAYQLMSLPMEALNNTTGLVAFPALSRLQHQPEQLRRYFLKGYSFFLSLVIPTTVACALFADDIVYVLLGPGWGETAGVFRLLAPTILVFAFTNPLFWLMTARGDAARALRIALVLTPLLILSYAVGLPYGPRGVAMAFSITMVLSALPVVLSAKHGTSITMRDIVTAAKPATISIVVAGAVALAFRPVADAVDVASLRLVADGGMLGVVYLMMLLFMMRQHAIYRQLLGDVGLWRAAKR